MLPWAAFASPPHQVELELLDLQTQQSIYYKFDPKLNAPPEDKPQIINLVRWQSQRTERNTSILIKAKQQDSLATVSLRFRGGTGAMEVKFECGPGVKPTPNASYFIYMQTKLRYEMKVSHHCPQAARPRPEVIGPESSD